MRKSGIILCLFISLFLFSCNRFSSEFKITKEFIDANLDFETKSEITLPKVKLSDLKDYEIANNQYISKGVVLVRDSENRLSAWNFFEQKFLFPFEDYFSITIQDDPYLGCYFKVMQQDSMYTIYDINGNVVLPTGKYEQASLTTNRVSKFDDYDNFIGNIYYETVTYKFYDNNEVFKKKYKINIEAKTRELLDSDTNKFDKTLRNKVNLKIVGLDNYYCIFVEPVLYVYNSKDELVNRINMLDSYNGIIFNGKIIVQNIYVTHDTNQEYDVIFNNQKCILETKSIDILTGREKLLQLDYVIKNGLALLDASGNSTLGYASINKIIGKVPQATTTNVIIDSNGKILYDLGTINLTELQKLADDTYYSPTKKYLFNENLEPIFALRSTPSFVQGDSMIIIKDDNYFGAIDYKGNILIPFEYQFIATEFYKGKTFATHMDGKKYIIDANDFKKTLPDNASILSPGVYAYYKVDLLNGKTETVISSFTDEVLLEVEYFDTNPLAFQSVGSIYANGKLTVVRTSAGENQYILLQYE